MYHNWHSSGVFLILFALPSSESITNLLWMGISISLTVGFSSSRSKKSFCNWIFFRNFNFSKICHKSCLAFSKSNGWPIFEPTLLAREASMLPPYNEAFAWMLLKAFDSHYKRVWQKGTLPPGLKCSKYTSGTIGLNKTKQLIWTTGQKTVPINIFTLREIGKTRSFGYVCVSQFA